MPGRTAVRRMGIRYRAETRTETIWSNAYSSAWIGNSAVADALAQLGPYWSYAARNVDPGKRLIYRKDATWAVEAPMIETFARCCTQAMNTPDLHSIPLPFPSLGSGRLSGRPNTAANSIASFDTYSADWDAHTINSIKSLLRAGGAPNIIWLDSPALLNGSQSTLNAVVVFPETTSSQPYLHTCSIDSRLQPGVKLTGSWLNPSVITGYLSGIGDTGTLGANYPRTYPTAAWARYLNLTIASQNRTLISKIASITGMWNSDVPAEEDSFGDIIETILATMVANGISRAGYSATLLGTLKGAADSSNYWLGGWGKEFLPRLWIGGGGGSAFNVDPDEQKSGTMLIMRATVNGYAYSYRGATQIAAMGTLTVYCMFAMLHFGWSSWTGWTSTSWETAPEIAALAMNSKPTNRLRNTGAGIATTAVFKENVRIMAKDGHVVMVFKDKEGGHSTIKPNRAYG
ncbi:hypothetical protein LTR50_007351 [Elasticomyces elasticus]|nr:hypothetical protein LTR50_007351 [Elasticomyces elasticus]